MAKEHSYSSQNIDHKQGGVQEHSNVVDRNRAHDVSNQIESYQKEHKAMIDSESIADSIFKQKSMSIDFIR